MPMSRRRKMRCMIPVQRVRVPAVPVGCDGDLLRRVVRRQGDVVPGLQRNGCRLAVCCHGHISDINAAVGVLVYLRARRHAVQLLLVRGRHQPRGRLRCCCSPRLCIPFLFILLRHMHGIASQMLRQSVCRPPGQFREKCFVVYQLAVQLVKHVRMIRVRRFQHPQRRIVFRWVFDCKICHYPFSSFRRDAASFLHGRRAGGFPVFYTPPQTARAGIVPQPRPSGPAQCIILPVLPAYRRAVPPQRISRQSFRKSRPCQTQTPCLRPCLSAGRSCTRPERPPRRSGPSR